MQTSDVVAMMTNLPLSRPTPHTRILAIGWEWSTLRSMGSTRFNILFSSSKYMSFPWKNKQTHKFFRSHNKNMQDLFPEAQDFAKQSSPLKVKRWLPVCTYVCVCVRLCASLNKWSNLKKRRWKMKGYWKRNEALSLSLSVLSLHIKHNQRRERERLHNIAPLSSLRSPLLHPSFDPHFRRLLALHNCSFVLVALFFFCSTLIF